MSMHLEFDPHAWYMGFAIKDNRTEEDAPRWAAYIDDGNTYRIIEREANTLERLRDKIRKYHVQHRTGYGERIAARRLEYLRGELRAERISYGELAELQGLANYIADDDVELLEPAGVPEGARQ